MSAAAGRAGSLEEWIKPATVFGQTLRGWELTDVFREDLVVINNLFLLGPTNRGTPK